MEIRELIYSKYGTRIAGPDESNESLQRFAYDGCRAMLKDTVWEILPGPVERKHVGTYDGEDIYAYLWPVAADGPACAWCKQPGHEEGDHPLPKDHPQYDAFYDADDDELSNVLAAAIRPGREG